MSAIKVFSKDGRFFEHCPPSNIFFKLSDYFIYREPYYIPITPDFCIADQAKVVDEFMEKINYTITHRIEHKVFKVEKDEQQYVMKKIGFDHSHELDFHLVDLPGKIELLDYWLSSRGITLIFPYYESDLFNYLVSKGNELTDLEIHSIVKQVAEALSNFHSKSLVYGDLKLENILINPNTKVIKICDLGLCKPVDYESTPGGSLEYMAPELNTDGYVKYQKSVDIWSLGVLINNLFHRGECSTFGNNGHFSMRIKLMQPFLAEKMPKIYKEIVDKIFTVAEKRPTIEQIIEMINMY